MSIFCVEELCAKERWNPEVIIIFGAAARYRRVKAAEAMTTRIQIIQRAAHFQIRSLPSRSTGGGSVRRGV